MGFLTFLSDNLFGSPAIFLGLIVMVGLMLQKKSTSQIISGTFKAIIGFLIINAGSGIIVGSLNVFQPMWQVVFGLEEMTFSNFMGQEVFSQSFGSAVTLSMTLGFLLNVLLARITKFKYIYLTGHMMFWTTTVFGGVIVQVAGESFSVTKFVILLSIVMGLYWTIQPAVVQPFLRKITGGNNVAIGHTAAFALITSAFVGKYLGNKEQDAEKINVPKKLDFLRDSNVITALTMGLLFVVGAIILYVKGGSEAQALIETSGSQNFIIYCIVQSFTFAAGIAVVLTGVRMFVGEIVPAFNGIATKVVPGAIPALDIPIVFPYAPNSVILGFVGAFIGALLWLVILGNTVGYVFVPTMIVLFFHGAGAGVFGNSTGGARGAVLGGFITATIVAVGQWFMVTHLLNTTIPDTAMWAADTDMFIIGPVLRWIAELIF